MALHHIEPERRTLHGHLSRDLAPVLTVDPGDTVRFRTLDAGWNLAPPEPGSEHRPRKFEPRDPDRDSGHALCGPIAIRGAESGTTLAVHVGTVRTGAYGWTFAGGWPSPVNQRLGVEAEGTFLRWSLDPDAGVARNQHGHEVALRPFLGVMGMPPDEPGIHSTTPPRHTGGNIDCKELVSGSTLYLPVAVPGGLFSAGDGHARQGDGEVAGPAIECPMERVDLTFDLRRDFDLPTSCADTPAGWITFGFHEDLNEAMPAALSAMLDLMGVRFGLSRPEALALASATVDLRITQIVNGVRGVHAVLPHDAIRQTSGGGR